MTAEWRTEMAPRKRPGTGTARRRRTAKVLPVRTVGTAGPDASDDAHGQSFSPEPGVNGVWEPGTDEPIDTGVPGDNGPDAYRAWRERARDSARGFFGRTTRGKMSDRERVHIIDTERSGDGTEGLDQREQLLKLRAETRLAAEVYMASLRDSNLLVPGFSDDERDGDVSVMHQVYMQMMMQACLKPLSRGVNTNAVIQAAGMMVAMRMLSPDFRKEMGSCYHRPADAVRGSVGRKFGGLHQQPGRPGHPGTAGEEPVTGRERKVRETPGRQEDRTRRLPVQEVAGQAR